MKTRIISGIIMGIIVAAVLALGFLWNPIVITFCVALIAAGAVYELLHNVAGIKSKAAWIGACLYAFLTVFALDFNNGYIVKLFELIVDKKFSSGNFVLVSLISVVALSIFYFIFAVIMTLKNHKDFDLAKIVSLYSLSLPYAFAYFCLSGVINGESGIYYLLLLLNFSSVCDMGAYFVGVTCGKHKLCPNISPKKTVEGAIGGIVSSMVVTVILGLCFSKSLVIPMILTVPFCIGYKAFCGN